MRKVLLNKYKYTYKDLFHWIGIIFLYFIGFYAYTFVILAFHYIQNTHFFITINALNWEIIYPLSIGPLISAILHIIYAERGIINIKLILWLHGTMIMLMIPIIIFVMN